MTLPESKESHGFNRGSMSIQAVEEPQKIADCLSVLDDVIEKQKAILAAWKELKKTCCSRCLCKNSRIKL